MNIDFPLVLVIVVLGSGGIWLLDSLLLAGGRRARREQLAQAFPGCDQKDSRAAIAYAEACDKEAGEPAVVEYARSFFPVLAVVLVPVPFSTNLFKSPHPPWFQLLRWVIIFWLINMLTG